MGSVSVYSGRFYTSQINDILEGRVVARKNNQDLELPEVIRIYPHSSRQEDFDKAFVIDMEHADIDTRREFLSVWRTQYNNQDTFKQVQNLRQYKDRLDGAYWVAHDQARRLGASEEEARRRGEENRAAAINKAMTTFLNKKGSNFKGIRVLSATAYQKEQEEKKKARERERAERQSNRTLA